MIVLPDFETTGLVTKSHDWMAQPGIVQIGAVKLDMRPVEIDGRVSIDGPFELQEIDSFYTLVNPERSQWEPEAIKTHGITPEKVADAPTFFEIGPAFARFCLGCDTWAGFNSKFDRDVLWYQLQRYGLERSYPWPLLEVDVMKLAGDKLELQGKRGMKNPKLVDAYAELVGGNYEGAHDALADVRATAKVWRATL